MNPGQRTVVAQVVEVLADGLRRDLETTGKVLHGHPPERASDIQDFRLTMRQTGHDNTSQCESTASMVRVFGGTVNEANVTRAAADRTWAGYLPGLLSLALGEELQHRALGFPGAAKQASFQRIEAMGGREKSESSV